MGKAGEESEESRLSKKKVSELKKIHAKRCEWYDVKVRGVLGSGKHVQKIETSDRN